MNAGLSRGSVVSGQRHFCSLLYLYSENADDKSSQSSPNLILCRDSHAIPGANHCHYVALFELIYVCLGNSNLRLVNGGAINTVFHLQSPVHEVAS